MKIKLFLILTVLIFAVSCSKQTTDPTNNNSPSSKDLQNYGTPVTPPSTGNTGETTPPFIDDGSAEYKGNAVLIIKSLDDVIETKPENITVYVDIFDDKTARIYTPNMFEFKNILTDGKEHTYNLEDNEGNYTLTMTVTADSINNFQFLIKSKIENYKYYITAEKLTKIQK